MIGVLKNLRQGIEQARGIWEIYKKNCSKFWKKDLDTDQCNMWKANICSVGQKNPSLIEPKFSLLYSQVAATNPYHESNKSSPNPPNTFLRYVSLIRLGLLSDLFSSGLLSKNK